MGLGSKKEAGRWAREGCVGLSRTSLSCRKSLALPYGSSRPCHMVGQTVGLLPPHSALHQWTSSRERRGAENCSSEEDLSDQDPFSFSRMGTSIFPAPAAWTAPVISCFQTEQAWRTNPGCKLNLAVHRGSERGEGCDLPGEMKTCSAKWGSMNHLQSEEQLVIWAEQRTSQRALCYSSTGWLGKVKASSTLEQKPSAGTKGSKTLIPQRRQLAPQEMHNIWSKSTQSS